MNDTHTSVIKLLLYYDIFDHPLTREEIIMNCNIDEDSSAKSGILEEVTEKKLIYKLDGYYSVRNDLSLVEKRRCGSELAAALLPKAFKMAKFISSFPFVRSVSLSGSISKDFMDDKKDIDYFIIVRPERLWLARTILILYKRIFLLNSYKYFCLNYFIDDEHLEIEQKNIFTATELFTLIPVTGDECIRQFIQANLWVKEYFHRFPSRDILSVTPENHSFLKKTMEWLLNNRFGNALDCLAMKLTIKFWKKKYKDDQNDLFNKSFRLKRYIAKYHPDNFQDLILERYRKKVNDFEKEKQISLN
jgi:hypothetical protein